MALAKMSGVSRETINNLLHERGDASEETLHKLAVALRVSLPGGGKPLVREVEGPVYPRGEMPASRRVYLDAVRELTGYGERGEPVPVAIAIKLLSGVYAATRPVSGAADADAADVREVEQLSQAEESDQGRSRQSG
jgi:transcriptional regulator with XRE-family HTH domain